MTQIENMEKKDELNELKEMEEWETLVEINNKLENNMISKELELEIIQMYKKIESTYKTLEEELRIELIKYLEKMLRYSISEEDLLNLSSIQCIKDSCMNEEPDIFSIVSYYYDLGFYKDEFWQEIWDFIKNHDCFNTNPEIEEKLKRYYSDDKYFDYSKSELEKIIEFGGDINRILENNSWEDIPENISPKVDEIAYFLKNDELRKEDIIYNNFMTLQAMRNIMKYFKTRLKQVKS